MRCSRRFLALVAALSMTACSDLVDPSKNKTEQVTGSLELLGTGPVHTFTVTKRGEYSLLLNSLTPATGSLIALSFGQIVANTCGYFTQVAARIGSPALSGPIEKGTYCFSLSDPGTLTQAETYALTISYP
jgi:hypothetical protein